MKEKKNIPQDKIKGKNRFLLLGICFAIITYSLYNYLNDSESYFRNIEKEYKEKQKNIDGVEKNILYIGSSRTYTHNIPQIVNVILLSMGLNTHYSYETITKDGVDLRYHWKNPTVQKALEKKYDFVIIQPETSDILKDIVNNTQKKPDNFYQFGTVLINKAKEKTQKVGLYQAWIPHYQKPLAIQDQLIPFSEILYAGMGEYFYNHHYENTKREYFNFIQNNHYNNLANQTDTHLIPVAKSWHRAEKECPTVNLFAPDQFNANIHGAYLIALNIVRFITNNDKIPENIFVPKSFSASDAKCLINTVNSDT